MVKKILIALGVFLLLLIIALTTFPFLFKDKINAKVKEEINNQLNAKVDYNDFGLTIINTFPNFSFSLNDFSIIGVNEFKDDTLAYVKNFNFTVDLLSVIRGEKYKLIALNIIEPNINAKVNEDGKVNWDIMKSTGGGEPGTSGPETKSNFSLEVKKCKIEKCEIIYDDKKGNSFARVHELNFEGSGNATQDIYDLATKTNITELTYRSGAISYLNKANFTADINLAVDNPNNKFTFKENDINLNKLGLQFEGFVQTKKNETDLEVKFKSKQTGFKSILSLIPAVYKKDFDKVKTSGTLALSGEVKGKYKDKDYPSFQLKLNIDNGMFQYPDLPVQVKDITIAAGIFKPQGDLNFTVIDISKLHIEADGNPIDAHINVKTPVNDPDIEASIKGKLDLASVPKFYPVEGTKTMTGLLNADINFKGRKSDVDKKNYQNIQASGKAKISGLVYDSKDIPMPVRVNDMDMTFNPKNITLNSFTAVLGKSDISANGSLENFIGYFFNQGDLIGVVNLKSNVFDANEWLRKDAAPTIATGTGGKQSADTAQTEYFKVPVHVDFTANSQFGKVYYDKMLLENVKGQVVIRDEAINLNNLFANLLGGSATISAKYITKKLDHPDVTFAYDIKSFDFQKTYNSVEMAGKMAPVMKHIQGNFSANLKGSGKLKKDMSVDYNSLIGDGKVEIPYAKIVDLPLLAELTKVVNIPALQNPEIKNAWTVIKFKDGRVNVEPTDFKLGTGYNINVAGSNGFDQTIDYDIRFDMATKELGSVAGMAQNLLSQIPGMSASLPEKIGFLLKATGTADKPQIKLVKILSNGSSAKDVINNAVDDLKKKAEEEAKKQEEQLKKQAQEAVDKQKTDADRQAREATDKAKKEAEQKAKDLFKLPH